MTHIFDVDSTVIKNTSAGYFLLEALKQKQIKLRHICGLPFELVKYKLAIPDFDFIENTVEKFKGMNKDDFEKIAELCFENRIKKNIYKGAENLIKNAQSAGDNVIFATSSFDFIIRPLEKHFGITGSVASRLEIIGGKTTGKLSGESCFGSKKKTAVARMLNENKINPKDVCFYSDSYTDIPLLEFCGKAAAVNPDRILKREAKKRGWEIMNFSL